MVVVAGQLASRGNEPSASYAVTALSLEDGQSLWSEALPAKPVFSGLALDAGGRVHVATEEGDVVCLTPVGD